MTRTLVDPHAVPAELRPYLGELVRRTHRLCGTRLVSVVAVGSVALGDYRHGRSDTDVTVVLDGTPPAPLLTDLAAALTHPALPCPAAGLELVVYDAGFAARPSGGAGYLLDLNTGPLLPARLSLDPAGSPGFWYVIDRSVAHQAGRTLYGAPAREAIAEPARADLLAAIRASVREHSAGDGHLADNRVLNGCRSVRHCRTGHWQPKRRAAREVAAAEERFRPLVEAALCSYERPSRTDAAALPAEEVRDFLAWVAGQVDAAAGGGAPPGGGPPPPRGPGAAPPPPAAGGGGHPPPTGGAPPRS
ncbi:aminoglycoside adenylyltransferase domain-containing protein, partial [Streptomyces sp. NPDC101117]|uniref:aminoglycoside adenylyltransferase domain-containing protein n=1 Tax=Streptomyces sp. NPDC101117 TaxID=3366108 RepID=UPI0038113B6D